MGMWFASGGSIHLESLVMIVWNPFLNGFRSGNGLAQEKRSHVMNKMFIMFWRGHGSMNHQLLGTQQFVSSAFGTNPNKSSHLKSRRIEQLGG